MKVKDVMSGRPACCTPQTSLQEVAHLMVEHDCGAIPVVEDGRKPVGIVTDRDITCRTLAEGKNPLDLTAGDCMTDCCTTVTPEMDLEECCQVLEEQQIRRVPVVDESGGCCGIVAQADVAEHAGQGNAGEVVRRVSQPTESASAVAEKPRRSGCH